MDNSIVNNISTLNNVPAQESRSNLDSLPRPSEEALAHSNALRSFIIEKIESQPQKSITFAEYMHLALFAPGLGYYSAGTQKFGAAGDFITAPEISPLYSRCIATQCMQIFETLGSDACLLEIGAGEGQMAVDILKELKELGCLPKQYYILEISADLKERQKKRIFTECPELFPLVHWLEELPKHPIKAIILANEVCDAMPINRFCLQNKEVKEILEFGVTYNAENQAFEWDMQSPETRLTSELEFLLQDSEEMPELYQSEFNLNIKPWIKSLADVIENGVILIIDYGFPRHEYYHPSRSMGTLMCHYRHHAHSDPFLYPGLQDITAHVDFTLIAEAALEANLEVSGFTTQAAFLLGTGLLQKAEQSAETKQKEIDEKAFFKQNQAIQLITSPAEIGELFKVMALSKNVEMTEALSGFVLNDMRYRL
jgi:SAM-dependent MidA family methyltransferase